MNFEDERESRNRTLEKNQVYNSTQLLNSYFRLFIRMNCIIQCRNKLKTRDPGTKKLFLADQGGSKSAAQTSEIEKSMASNDGNGYIHVGTVGDNFEMLRPFLFIGWIQTLFLWILWNSEFRLYHLLKK